jgi:hypothetical protein
MGQYQAEPRRSFQYKRSTPIIVSQGDGALCWAAALESWLDIVVRENGEQTGTWEGEDARRNFFEGSPWKRESLDVKKILVRWKDLTNSDGSLKPEKMPMIALEIGMVGSVFLPHLLKEESLQEKLKTNGCLYIIYFSVQMNHAVVAYGYDTSDGLLVMDPNPSRGLITRKVEFFKEPIRLQKMMFVGWAV